VLAVQNYGSPTTTVWSLDRTKPAATWVGRSIGLPGIFTGFWPVMIDDTKRELLFMDGKTPTLYAYSITAGTVRTICKLPCVSLYSAAMGLVASIAAAFIPEHRSVVLFWEPFVQNVGPYSSSLTINVDTGVITDGPRFPNYDDVNRPWFPGKAVWYPPTQELVVYAFMYDDVRLNITVPQTNYRYKWIA
jgi:hypothetical protein